MEICRLVAETVVFSRLESCLSSKEPGCGHAPGRIGLSRPRWALDHGLISVTAICSSRRLVSYGCKPFMLVRTGAHRGSKNKNDGLAPRAAFSSAARTPNRSSPATGDHARPSSSAKTNKRFTYFCVTRTCAVPQELPLEQGARRQCDGLQNSELARMVLGEPLGSHLHSSLLRPSSS